jgi:hypothetical protein
MRALDARIDPQPRPDAVRAPWRVGAAGALGAVAGGAITLTTEPHPDRQLRIRPK